MTLPLPAISRLAIVVIGCLATPWGIAVAVEGEAAPKLVPLNLADGKPATASASQAGHDPAHATDGDPGTRWCAANDQPGYWWQVDLGQPEDLTGCRITWESGNGKYNHRIEGSVDGKDWSTLVDDTAERGPVPQEQAHQFDAKGVRYLRMTVTGLDPGRWASFFEFEVYGTKMVDPATAAERKNEGLLREIKAPPGLAVTLFAAPPDASYPVCLAAAATGEVFVAVDPNGSLDQKPGRGRVVRCRDTDDDGRADEFKTFAEVDSPRGMAWDGATNTLYVQHPPFVRAFHDDDRDGVADRNTVLVEGLGYGLEFRGADHTTNGMQIGIDGWLYVAVGDYGFLKATGADGKSLQFHGGGVVRVRPDGSRLEVVSRGQRNIYDVAVSPTLDLFTRDNTNDGDGWDVRLSHVVPTGQYGYPSLFKNFADEIVQPLAIYGGGSPTGSVYLDEPGLPDGLGRGLYTCDWGRNIVYRHPLEPSGATFTARQDVFLEMPRPIDMEVDGQSRLYVASWRNGGFNYSGPDVGYVARVVDPSFRAAAPSNLKELDDPGLVAELGADSHTRRLAAQREILARGAGRADWNGLNSLAGGHGLLPARVAALYTIAQLSGEGAFLRMRPHMESLALREHAIRAATDDDRHASSVPTEPIASGLHDQAPRIRLHAVVALGRLDRTDAAAAIVPLVADPDPVVAHAAVIALVSLKAVEPCFAAIDSSQTSLIPGVVRVLQARHDPRVVAGLIERLDRAPDPSIRKPVLTALARLYHREAEWTEGWWGTRPDTSGPYFHAETWEQTETIRAALVKALGASDPDTLRHLLIELQRHKVELSEATPKLLALAREDESFRTKAAELLVTRPGVPPEAIPLLAETAVSEKQDAALRARAVAALYRSGNADGLDAAVGVLARLGGDDDAQGDLARARQEFVRDGRHAGNVEYFRKLASAGDGAGTSERELGFAVLLQVATSKQSPPEAAKSAAQAVEEGWGRPDTAAALLRAIGRDRVEAYAYQVKAHVADEREPVKLAAAGAAAQLGLGERPGDSPDKVMLATLPYEQTLAATVATKGDAKVGEQLFLKQGCIACHTVAKNEPPKGPYLGGIAQRYRRSELVESIVKPNAKIAQGFVTRYFVTKNRERVDGFIVREAGDEVEVRGASGVSTVVKNADVARKGTLETSIMPEGLADNLSTEELASLLAYLEALKAE